MRTPTGIDISRGLKWGPFWIVVFWTVVMGVLYFAMNHYLKPKKQIVTASGDLIIPRSIDGHFYAQGTVNGSPANFMVDTGATLVMVSDQLARRAEIGSGIPATFQTANGELSGRIVPGVSVSVGPVSVTGVRVAVGLVGRDAGEALLGQSFLSKFDVVFQKDQMTLRKQ
jgi:aspartyl protease family protein